VLDLSGNHLKDFAGLILGKIISVHVVRRDEMRWFEEIRGDDIVCDEKRNRLRIILNHPITSSPSVIDCTVGSL
jgi:hypothetical protein